MRFAIVAHPGTTCPWCLMLSSRGAVYKTAETADRSRHTNCGCQVVPLPDGETIPGYDPSAIYDQWKSLKGNPKPSEAMIKKDSQLGKKIGKHAHEWGCDPSSEEGRAAMLEIIDGIIDDYDSVRYGEWRSQPYPCRFFIKGEDVVVVNAKNEFVTILKGGVENERVKNARNLVRRR